MILVSLITVAATLVVVSCARLLLRRRRSLPPSFPLPPGGATLEQDEPAAALLPTRPLAPNPAADEGRAIEVQAAWQAYPDLQPAQLVYPLRARTLIDDEPLGLTITARAVGSAGYPEQDAYYVQRNVVVLARGLTSVGAAQRAASLALSGVMTSALGQTRDVEKTLREAVKTSNALVRSVARREPQYSEMVTTLDVVFIDFRDDLPTLHFAHVGNSTIWIYRTAGGPVEQLTEPHAFDGGPVLRAVGLTAELAPDIGTKQIGLGDRVFMATANPYFAVPTKLIQTIAAAHADQSLQDCVAALADALEPAAAPDGLTILAAEVARPALLLTI
ncbi:MAG TPA: hypothetical protein VGG83_27080 [Trebonia sp.]